MRSVMQHSFAETPRANIPRSSFSRGSAYKTTLDADYLVPVFVDDVVPGDTFNLNMNFFARMATPLYPVMDNVFLDSFWFFVPYRLLWDNWAKMHGAQDDPGDSIDFAVPTITGASATDVGEVWNYFGLPIGKTPNNHAVSALPFRAYKLIWNEWFRDENLQDSLVVTTTDTDDALTDTDAANTAPITPYKRGKRHDYFTSCLPWPQKGDAVSMSLGGSAPVATDGTDGNFFTMLKDNAGGAGTPEYLDHSVSSVLTIDNQDPVSTNPMYADLTNATAGTINDLRLAFQTQRLLERDARSGTRYNELILSHFGVTVPDFRVQRPEFLGGGSSAVNVNAVAQTSGQPTPVADDKLGNLAGIGTASI